MHQGADCGKNWVCCGATADKDGTSTKIYTNEKTGIVPSTVTTKFAGFEYFCTHKDHKEAVIHAAALEAGSTNLAVSTVVAAASAFLLA